jgi:predicted GNAT family acetyltransferase
VHTPPEERRKGYAGQLTAVVSSHLIQRGIGLMLFTDVTNVTSNGVYARLGYERVDEMVECVLEPVQRGHRGASKVAGNPVVIGE